MPNTITHPSAFSAPVFSTAVAHDVSVIQARHPEIGETITKLWGSADLQDYLNSLIFDERGGRQGFAEPAASALFRIYEGHKSLFQVKKIGDIWDVILEPLK